MSNSSNIPSSRGGGSGPLRPEGCSQSRSAMRASRSGLPGPLGEVAICCRCVAAQVAPPQLRQRLVPIHRRKSREPVLEQDERLLAADNGSTYAHTPQRRKEQNVRDGLAQYWHSRHFQFRPELRTSGRSLAQPVPDNRNCALGLRLIHSFLPKSGSVAAGELRRGQRVQPREVLAAHQVQRPAVEPAHDKLALGQGSVHVRCGQPRRARSYAQPRPDEVLRLQREQLLDDTDGLRGRRPAQQLRSQASSENVHAWILP